MERTYLVVATNGMSMLNLRVRLPVNCQTEDEFYDELIEEVQKEKGFENAVITSIMDLTEFTRKLKE